MRRIDAATLMAYADGELSQQQSAEVEAYLASHPSAAASIETQRAVWAAIGAAVAEQQRTVELSHSVADAVMARVGAVAHQKRRAWLRRSAVVSAVVLAAAAVALVALWSPAVPRLAQPVAAVVEADDEWDEDPPESPTVVSVDFGTSQGVVFYVLGDAKDAKTPVVWVTEVLR